MKEGGTFNSKFLS